MTFKFQEWLTSKSIKGRTALRREGNKFGFQMGFRELSVQNVTSFNVSILEVFTYKHLLRESENTSVSSLYLTPKKCTTVIEKGYILPSN